MQDYTAEPPADQMRNEVRYIMKLFDIDGGLFRTLSRISDLIILNLLFLVTAIPVVTIGVNLTAVCSITNKMVRNEESYIWRSYWKSWKQNFRQGLIIWLVFLAFGAFLLADCFLASRMGNGGFPLKVIFTLLFVFWIMGLSYVFPILSRFDNSTKNIIRNAILMSIRHLPFS